MKLTIKQELALYVLAQVCLAAAAVLVGWYGMGYLLSVAP
jgi:hypothetical protein